MIRDVQLAPHGNCYVFFAGKGCKQINRSGIRAARCAIERRMGKLVLALVIEFWVRGIVH